jgi:hypothetical protein
MGAELYRKPDTNSAVKATQRVNDAKSMTAGYFASMAGALPSSIWAEIMKQPQRTRKFGDQEH